MGNVTPGICSNNDLYRHDTNYFHTKWCNYNNKNTEQVSIVLTLTFMCRLIYVLIINSYSCVYNNRFTGTRKINHLDKCFSSLSKRNTNVWFANHFKQTGIEYTKVLARTNIIPRTFARMRTHIRNGWQKLKYSWHICDYKVYLLKYRNRQLHLLGLILYWFSFIINLGSRKCVCFS